MKCSGLHKLIVALVIILSATNGLNAQTNFNPEQYLQFLIDNKDLDSKDFISRFEPDRDFYSEIKGVYESPDILYLDSIKEKYELTDDEISLLMKNYFVVSEKLSFNKMTPALDDVFIKDMPVFVSTDAILHALHISYDNLLRDIEMQLLLPELKKGMDMLYEVFPDLVEKYSDNNRFQASLADLDLYITIAKSLLDEELQEAQYASEQKLGEIWDGIQSEDFVSMALFTDVERNLDFSQFTIRGHYEKYEELHGYFKCMIWLGRMEFVLADAPKEWYEAGFDKEGLRRLNITALMLNEMLESGGLLNGLNEIDRIIGFMVGESDNLRPVDYSELVAGQGITGPEYLLDDNNFDSFVEVMKNSPDYQQKILSGYMKGTPESTEPTPLPISYRLMGQRFIIDSYIFYKLVYDNIVYQDNKVCRMMPNPLDAMFALGNDNALPLLEEELETWNYSSQLAGLRYLVDSYDEDFWGQSLYNNWLQAIRLVGPAELAADPPLFMSTVAWQQQKLNTQLASWTQLRHDNLLYAKQSYTHGGECMFPHSYVEPYPDFYAQLASFAREAGSFDAFESIRGYATYQGVGEYFTALEKTMNMLEEISRKELNGLTLDVEETDFLGDMLFEGNMSGPEFNGWYVDLLYDSDGGPSYVWEPSQSDYVIADVHTQPTDCAGNVVGRVLHVGVGKVNLGVFIAESPSSDYQPMAYVGPVMSYYENITEDFDRLTDTRWTKIVDEGLEPSRPDWVNVYMADKKGESFEQGRELDGVLYTGIDPSINNPDFGIVKVYPNPFSDIISISYEISSDSKEAVGLDIFNITGQKVESLTTKTLAPGNHQIEWDASALGPGLYFIQLRAGDKVAVRKVVKKE